MKSISSTVVLFPISQEGRLTVDDLVDTLFGHVNMGTSDIKRFLVGSGGKSGLLQELERRKFIKLVPGETEGNLTIISLMGEEDDDDDEEVISGPYKILWDTKDLTSVTYPRKKEIRISRIPEESVIKPSVLAHEIAHSRLLNPSMEYVKKSEDEAYTAGQAGAWIELEAVMYTLAKGWESDMGMNVSTLKSASRFFGDRGFKDSKVIARKILGRLRARGQITGEEEKKGLARLGRVSRKVYEEA